MDIERIFVKVVYCIIGRTSGMIIIREKMIEFQLSQFKLTSDMNSIFFFVKQIHRIFF